MFAFYIQREYIIRGNTLLVNKKEKETKGKGNKRKQKKTFSRGSIHEPQLKALGLAR